MGGRSPRPRTRRGPGRRPRPGTVSAESARASGRRRAAVQRAAARGPGRARARDPPLVDAGRGFHAGRAPVCEARRGARSLPGSSARTGGQRWGSSHLSGDPPPGTCQRTREDPTTQRAKCGVAARIVEEGSDQPALGLREDDPSSPGGAARPCARESTCPSPRAADLCPARSPPGPPGGASADQARPARRSAGGDRARREEGPSATDSPRSIGKPIHAQGRTRFTGRASAL